MASLSTREAVEIFHLLFLRVLTSGPDKAHYVVKGGCNLRFFFQSIRYSEDLDIDITVVAKQTLKNKIDRALSSAPLVPLLRSRGLAIVDLSAPKQTDTTQRWKIGLSVAGSALPLRTKIEFSRRGAAQDSVFGAVDAELARHYGITAPLANHYAAAEAVEQKLAALAQRPETQARDVFDLHLLLSTRPELRVEVSRTVMDKATECAMSLSFDDFSGQVVAYLSPEHQSLYRSKESWDQMQGEVVDAIARLGK